jgi:hypothetical protein
MTGKLYTATFPLAGRAVAFAALIQQPGWSCYDVARSGKTVTWYSEADAIQHTMDMRETVGSVGSDMTRRAKLNGYPCKMEY